MNVVRWRCLDNGVVPGACPHQSYAIDAQLVVHANSQHGARGVQVAAKDVILHSWTCAIPSASMPYDE